MILLIHNAGKLKKIKHGKKARIDTSALIASFWEYAELYPEEIIGWCDEKYEDQLAVDHWDRIFSHELVMASYCLETPYLPDSIGYIDQLPFVNVNREVKYPTWRMSSDVGGIKALTLLKFKEKFSDIADFEFLLTSIAKIGQQNGLLCYSEPSLIKADDSVKHYWKSREKNHKASTKDLFNFVVKFYKWERSLLLFWCYTKYKRSFPILSLIQSGFVKKLFGVKIDLDSMAREDYLNINLTEIDVILPTLGRPDYLFKVMEDLASQSLLPKKVIVVEQNADPKSVSELHNLKRRSWPFEVVHIFTHQTGACSARNRALDKVTSDWVFFADDDNQMENNVLERAMIEIQRFGLNCLTLHYPQKGEKRIFDKIKQWGTFGAGNSIVANQFASKIRFDPSFEYGYGEDKDYGMQLRKAGCDIIYHPDIHILHLKAPRGGFREYQAPPWDKDKPKPSPTLMLYAKKYYTQYQLNGFKEELLIRFYKKQNILNPFSYYRNMNLRWKKSEFWSQRLRDNQKNLSKS